jgi:hypothetical protein
LIKFIEKLAKKKAKRPKKKVKIENLGQQKGRRLGALVPDMAVF